LATRLAPVFCHRFEDVRSDPGVTGAFRLESKPEFLSALLLPAFFLTWESFRCHGAGRDRACVHLRAGLAFRHADPGIGRARNSSSSPPASRSSVSMRFQAFGSGTNGWMEIRYLKWHRAWRKCSPLVPDLEDSLNIPFSTCEARSDLSR